MRVELTATAKRKLKTFKEGAVIVGVSERTFWGWANEGLIQTVSLGPKLKRVHDDELERVMREGVSCRLADRA